jgi:MFS family permease
MADIWPPQQRGVAIVGYAVTIVGGPTIGPIIGGAITSSYLGWRWVEYLTGIVMMAQFVLDVCFLDESYAPVLLAKKARRLRLTGKNFALHAKVEAMFAPNRCFKMSDPFYIARGIGSLTQGAFAKIPHSPLPDAKYTHLPIDEHLCGFCVW